MLIGDQPQCHPSYRDIAQRTRRRRQNVRRPGLPRSATVMKETEKGPHEREPRWTSNPRPACRKANCALHLPSRQVNERLTGNPRFGDEIDRLVGLECGTILIGK